MANPGSTSATGWRAVATNRIKVYFDTCVFLAVFLPSQSEEPEARLALQAAERGATQGFISSLVLAETIGNAKLRAPQGVPGVERDRRIDLARDYFLASGFTYVEAAARSGRRAMQYAIDHQLSGPDSLHLALAVMSGCDQLHTFDKGLLRVGCAVPGLEVCKPRVDQASLFE